MNIQRELKVYVERSIRPVVAATRSKLKMRTELLAHVQDAYQRELDRKGNESTALEETVRRTGAPTALTAEYQKSVPWYERTEASLDNFMRRRKGETRIRHAWRLASFFTIGFGAVIGLTFLFESPEILAWTVRGQIAVRFGIGIAFLFGMNMFVFTILAGIVRDQLEQAVVVPRFILYCFGYSLVTGLCLLATGWGFVFGVSFDSLAATESLWRWSLLAMAIPALSGLVFFLDLCERRQSQEWTSLEIDS